MRAEQPLRTLVVEVVQRALLQLHGSLRLEAVGIFARLLAWRGGGHNLGHPVTKVMRVQPVAAEFIQPPCGGGSADGGGSAAWSTAAMFGVRPSGKGKASNAVVGV